MHRTEVLELIEDICKNELQCDYFITTRGSSKESTYYLVWTILRQRDRPVVVAPPNQPADHTVEEEEGCSNDKK